MKYAVGGMKLGLIKFMRFSLKMKIDKNFDNLYKGSSTPRIAWVNFFQLLCLIMKNSRNDSNITSRSSNKITIFEKCLFDSDLQKNQLALYSM